jgi:hypothetical protein
MAPGGVKRKITVYTVIFASGRKNSGRRFSERLDAPCAEHFLDLAVVLHQRNPLQVGEEFAIGGAQGKRAIMPEGGCLPAVSTLGHPTRSFLANDSR